MCCGATEGPESPVLGGGCGQPRTQRAQYPLIKEYTLNYRGLSTVIKGLCLYSLN